MSSSFYTKIFWASSHSNLSLFQPPEISTLLFLNLPHHYTDFIHHFWILVSIDSLNQFLLTVKMKKNDFFHYRFSTKVSIDAINLDNILHHKNATNKVPPYFKDKLIPIISYSYTSPIASKMFNYKRLLQNL